MEIGSIIEIDPVQLFKPEQYDIEKELLHSSKYKTEYFNTGRAAIETLLKQLSQINNSFKLYMPSYVCSSVFEAAERAGMNIIIYPVERDMYVNIEELLDVKKGDAIYILQYFGMTYSDDFISLLSSLKKKGVIVIEDITLALLSRNDKKIWFGDYVVGSLRKWFPIPDGGFISYTDTIVNKIEKSPAANDYSFYYFVAQIMKDAYLKDTRLNKNQFLDLSNIGMATLFSDYTIREISNVSLRLLKTIDYEDLIERRIRNYDYLYQRLSTIDEIRILVKRNEGMVPLGMVITVKNRDEFCRYLVDNNIYCNIHWRENKYSVLASGSKWLSEHCLTIPCDQRYGIEHMNYIYEIIKSYFEGQ